MRRIRSREEKQGDPLTVPTTSKTYDWLKGDIDDLKAIYRELAKAGIVPITAKLIVSQYVTDFLVIKCRDWLNEFYDWEQSLNEVKKEKLKKLRLYPVIKDLLTNKETKIAFLDQKISQITEKEVIFR